VEWQSKKKKTILVTQASVNTWACFIAIKVLQIEKEVRLGNNWLVRLVRFKHQN
jgi:hypothetical protein